MKSEVARRAIKATYWPAMPIELDNITGNQALITGPCLLRGWAVCNKNAASQDFVLVDGNDASGTTLAFIHLASGGISNQGLDNTGVLCDQGVFLTGTGFPLKGGVYVTPLTGPDADLYEACEDARMAGWADGTRGLRIPGNSASQHAPGDAPGNANANAGQASYQG